MGVRYDSAGRLLGIPLTRYRDVVAAWGRSGPERALLSAGRHGLTPEEMAVCIDDAAARGLVGGPDAGYARSRGGIALVGATPLRPIPAARARGILADLVARASDANARDNLPFHVERIWLYGSLARGAAEVNDVDVVVEVSHEMGAVLDPERGAELIRMAEAMGGAAALRRRMGAVVNAIRFIRDRALYGDRRHPRLSVGVLDELVDMHRPCRLVFDSDRGGPVDDPLLPHHPASRGRCTTMPEPDRLPDLVSRTAPAPLALDLALRVARAGAGPDVDAAALARVSATHAELPAGPLAAWMAARGPLDGTRRGALRLGDSAAVLVERATAGDGSHRTRIADAVALGRPGPDHWEADALAHVLATAMALDARKAGMRGEPFEAVPVACEATPAWAGLVAALAEGRRETSSPAPCPPAQRA